MLKHSIIATTNDLSKLALDPGALLLAGNVYSVFRLKIQRYTGATKDIQLVQCAAAQ